MEWRARVATSLSNGPLQLLLNTVARIMLASYRYIHSVIEFAKKIHRVAHAGGLM